MGRRRLVRLTRWAPGLRDRMGRRRLVRTAWTRPIPMGRTRLSRTGRSPLLRLALRAGGRLRHPIRRRRSAPRPHSAQRRRSAPRRRRESRFRLRASRCRLTPDPRRHRGPEPCQAIRHLVRRHPVAQCPVVHCPVVHCPVARHPVARRLGAARRPVPDPASPAVPCPEVLCLEAGCLEALRQAVCGPAGRWGALLASQSAGSTDPPRPGPLAPAAGHRGRRRPAADRQE